MRSIRYVQIRRALGLLSGLMLGMGGLAVSTITEAAAGTEVVTGSFTFSNDLLGCTAATGICFSGTMRGGIQGRLEAGVLSSTPSVPAGVLVAVADVVVRTSTGDLRCTANGAINATSPDGETVALCVITGGTGTWTGASGYFQMRGNSQALPLFPSVSGTAEYTAKVTTR